MMQITIEALLAFYERVGAKDTCPFCARSEWVVQTGDPGILLLTDSGDPPKLTFKQGVSVLYIFCTNCGYVRLQALKPLLDKKEVDANAPKQA